MNVGDRVRITSGAFSGEAGVIRKLFDSGAALIKLDMHEEGQFQAEAGNYELVQKDSDI